MSDESASNLHPNLSFERGAPWKRPMRNNGRAIVCRSVDRDRWTVILPNGEVRYRDDWSEAVLYAHYRVRGLRQMEFERNEALVREAYKRRQQSLDTLVPARTETGQFYPVPAYRQRQVPVIFKAPPIWPEGFEPGTPENRGEYSRSWLERHSLRVVAVLSVLIIAMVALGAAWWQ